MNTQDKSFKNIKPARFFQFITSLIYYKLTGMQNVLIYNLRKCQMSKINTNCYFLYKIESQIYRNLLHYITGKTATY